MRGQILDVRGGKVLMSSCQKMKAQRWESIPLSLPSPPPPPLRVVLYGTFLCPSPLLLVVRRKWRERGVSLRHWKWRETGGACVSRQLLLGDAAPKRFLCVAPLAPSLRGKVRTYWGDQKLFEREREREREREGEGGRLGSKGGENLVTHSPGVLTDWLTGGLKCL